MDRPTSAFPQSVPYGQLTEEFKMRGHAVASPAGPSVVPLTPTIRYQYMRPATDAGFSVRIGPLLVAVPS